MDEFRTEGYLPEALVNFLALLGWSYDDRTEIMSREELMAGLSEHLPSLVRLDAETHGFAKG